MTEHQWIPGGEVVKYLARCRPKAQGLAAQRLVLEVVEDVVSLVRGGPELLHPHLDGAAGLGLRLGLHLGVGQQGLHVQQLELQVSAVAVDAPHAGDLLNERVGGLADNAAHHREEQRLSHGRCPCRDGSQPLTCLQAVRAMWTARLRETVTQWGVLVAQAGRKTKGSGFVREEGISPFVVNVNERVLLAYALKIFLLSYQM